MIKAVILDADTVTGGDVSLESITSLAETKVYGFWMMKTSFLGLATLL